MLEKKMLKNKHIFWSVTEVFSKLILDWLLMAKCFCFMIITRVIVRDNKDVFLYAPHVFLFLSLS